MTEYRPPQREDAPTPAPGRMPFPGHRTQREVREGEKPGRARDRHKLGRVCASCPAPISDASTTGLCKPCFLRASNADPVMRKRRGEGLSKRLKDDRDLYGRKCALLATARSKRDREAMVARGRELARIFPAHEEKRRAAHAIAMRRRRHQWLPDEWRPTYYKMVKSLGYRAPEAKRVILAQIEKERAALSNPAIGSRRLLEAILRAHG